MSDSGKIKVFISWSGDLAREVAVALRDWLPVLFDNVDPWTSDTDIDPGARSLDNIHTALQDSAAGIVVITSQNQDEPWLNYEAGALAKTVSNDTTRVVPLLVDIDSPTQLTGPISQFQAKPLDKAGMSSIAAMLGRLVDADLAALQLRLDLVWPQLEEKLSAITSARSPQPNKPRRAQPEILDEILGIVRLLRDERRQPQWGLASDEPLGGPVSDHLFQTLLQRELAERNLSADVEPVLVSYPLGNAAFKDRPLVGGTFGNRRSGFVLRIAEDAGNLDDIQRFADEAELKYGMPVKVMRKGKPKRGGPHL